MKHLFFIIICCFLKPIPGFSQNGYQKVFLDNNLIKTDSSGAYFWGYEFYENGKIISEKFPRSYNYKDYKLIFDGSSPAKGSPIPLDGVFKWVYSSNGIEEVADEYTFKHGHTLLYKEFLGGELTLLIDFTKKYNGEEGSCYLTDYVSYKVSSEKRKKKTCYWYRKVENKWKRVKTPCE